MEADKLKELFDSAQSNSDKLQFTAEESEKFRKAFDEPEFRKLFSEYMDELQDPKHREENEAYISQLETEKKVPEGKELIRPDPGFVAKTSKTAKDTQTSEKLFLNVVQSTKIAAPTKTTTPKGDCWSVPYSLGPPHMERDKEGNNAPCFDCCFNPEALTLSKRHKEFRDLLVHTAMEGVEQMYKTQHQEVTLKRDFHVVKGIDYKSGQVPTMMIPIASKAKWDTSKNPLPEPPAADNKSDKSSTAPKTSEAVKSATSSNVPPPAAPMSAAPSSTEKKKATPAIKKGFLNNAKTTIYPESVTAKNKSANSSSNNNIKLSADPEPEGDLKKLSLNDNKGQQQQPKKSLIQEIKPGSEPPKQVEPTVVKTRSSASNSDSFLKPVSTTLKTPPPSSNSSSIGSTANSTPADVGSTAPAASSSPVKPLSVPTTASSTAAPLTPSTAAHRAATTSPAVDSPSSVNGSSSVSSNAANSTVEGPAAPKYSVKERGNVSMGDFEAMKDTVASNRPSELVYRIELPLVTKAAQVVLDVAEKHLSLTYLDVYKLSIELPYPVWDTKGTAKYDKTAKCLNVTLPVKPAPRTTLSKPSTPSVKEQQQEVEKEDEVSSAPVSPAKKAAAAPPSGSHSRWLSTENSAATSGASATASADDWKKEIAEKAQQALEEAKRAAAEKPSSSPSAAVVAPSSQSAAVSSSSSGSSIASAVEISGDFTACVSFSGARLGYVFRNGDLGIGYYRDARYKTSRPGAAVSSAAVSSTTPAVEVSGETIKQYAAFAVESKQSDANVALLVQVPHILASSVAVQYTTHSVSVSFTAGSAAESGSGVVTTLYGAVLSFDSAVCSGGIDITKSRFDVASQNMVIVLVKAKPGLWVTSGELYQIKPYSSATSAAAAADVGKAGTTAGKEGNGGTTTTAVKDLKSAINSMQFSSSSVLYDLD